MVSPKEKSSVLHVKTVNSACKLTARLFSKTAVIRKSKDPLDSYLQQ